MLICLLHHWRPAPLACPLLLQRPCRLGNNLGRGLTYNQVKAGPMRDDTIEGAELGRAVAASLRAMMAAGTLVATRLPLTQALLDCLTNDTPLDPPWAKFHTG